MYKNKFKFHTIQYFMEYKEKQVKFNRKIQISMLPIIFIEIIILLTKYC